MAKNKETFGAGEFKSRCLGIFDEIQKRRISVIITKHGRPIVRVIPYEEGSAKLFGCLKGSVVIKGDIVSSSGESWNAESEESEY